MAALAMICVAATGALSACGGQDTSKDARTLTWYINPDSGGNDPSKTGQAHLAKVCTEKAQGKYRITTQVLPNSASDQRQQLLRRLAAGDPGVDIMSMDPVFVAEFAEAGFLTEVPEDKQAKLTEDAVKPIVESAMWKDKMVAAPMWANTQVLWYRKSMAEKAGLDMTKPVTWDQLVDASKELKTTIGVQAKPYEGYTVWINALIESGGGHIIQNEGASADQLKLGLDTPQGKKAAEVIGNIARIGVGGPAMGSSDETAALDAFAGGGAFLVNWPYTWAALPEKGTDTKDIGFTRYPRVEADKESRPPLGGIELGVNAKSANPEAAWEAIQCITSEENQKAYMLGTGNPAARKKVYDDPEIQKAFPMATLIRESLDAGGARPSSQYYGDISTALYKRFSPPAQVNEGTPAVASDFILKVLKGEALL
ncbi:extracellular solute-binding protein [Mobilicoccus pelagius]|uniref:Putative sugar ABC transporter substrate-binding protein n=1 Tax=Mobilicoccus pelagius NBRC 104925 TaxID=1089455 RepID=H5URB0_9MICO|nr:extracellular solute-binding protein [Mobilicoccus pelagius]GAB48268.1 putative sugar ABC transporter substrate-binding protein [Mobilicoccus pelagius NBRC 104925]